MCGAHTPQAVTFDHSCHSLALAVATGRTVEACIERAVGRALGVPPMCVPCAGKASTLESRSSQLWEKSGTTAVSPARGARSAWAVLFSASGARATDPTVPQRLCPCLKDKARTPTTRPRAWLGPCVSPPLAWAAAADSSPPAAVWWMSVNIPVEDAVGTLRATAAVTVTVASAAAVAGTKSLGPCRRLCLTIRVMAVREARVDTDGTVEVVVDTEEGAGALNQAVEGQCPVVAVAAAAGQPHPGCSTVAASRGAGIEVNEDSPTSGPGGERLKGELARCPPPPF